MAQSGDCTEHPTSDAFNLDALMVVVSVIMGILAVLILVRGLLGRLSGAATTHPTIRFFLWVVFALFLPLTSYMFSAAKNSGEDLLRPQLILLWMLLAELLRKRLEGVCRINGSPLQGVNKQSAWDAVDQMVGIAWIGYLIYQYAITSVLVILWAFSIIKVAQRVAAVEVAKCSFASGKNPKLIAGYMRQILSAKEQQREAAATAGEEENATWTMTACEYVIMGEDKVRREAGPHGYTLQISDAKERKRNMVTVGDVWQLAASGDALFSSQRLKLKDLCLSFALYKLLRRRFEGYPSAEAGRRESLDFLLCGLLGDKKDERFEGYPSAKAGRRESLRFLLCGLPSYDNDDKDADGGSAEERKGDRVFRVIEDELRFLGDYYFSTIPLMLSNHWFFLLNCVLVFVIPLLCLIVMVVSIVRARDGLIWSLFDQLIHHTKVTLPILYDPIVTLLLIVTLFLLELSDIGAYAHSDWVMVSLLCAYEKNPSWQQSATVRRALSTLRRLSTLRKHPELKFNQHSVLEPRSCTLPFYSQLVQHSRSLFIQSMLLKRVLCRRFLGVQRLPVPKEVKAAIVKYLVDNKGRGPELPIGKSVLQPNGAAGEELLQACKSEGAAETIIVWHIATCLYEMKHPSSSSPSDDHDMRANRRIAETLSKYCAYLVALAPELLPDDTAATATAYKAAVQDAILKHDRKVGVFERVTRMKKEKEKEKEKETAAVRGAELGYQLVTKTEWDEPHVWKLLAQLWTEIVVYVAPSDNVKSHAEALAPGGEFITHVWALLTHGGILRWPDPPAADHSQV